MTKEELLELINQAKRGKQMAQTTLMNLLWDRIYYFILPKIKNETDAEDITIRTFTKVFQKLKLYNEDFDFPTWVRSIAYNTMIDHIRRKSDVNVSLDDDFSPLELETAAPTPEQNLILKQNTTQLLESIDSLPKIYQEVIQLRYLEDKTYKEIAKKLNLTLANVKVRILRGKKLLEEAMEENEP